jgi:hypothetical protein
MARTYGSIGAGGFAGGTTRIYADDFNNIREAISRRADVSGASVSLPAVVAAGAEVSTDFETWMLAARQAIEDILDTGKFLSYSSGVWAAWTKSSLLTYVNTTWVPSVMSDDWASYTKPGANPWYVRYINQIYFALECLCFHDPGTSEKSKARQIKTGNGSDGDDGGDPLVDGTETVNSETQSGSFGAAVGTSTVVVSFANLDFSVWWSGHDDGAGGWITDSAEGCSFVSGYITYSTGEWSVTTDFVFPAGGTLNTAATSAPVTGSYGVALGAAWVDFAAQSYGATGAAWEARGCLHLYASGSGNIKYAVVENTKVTDAQATVPDLAYPDVELYFPYQWVYMPASPSPTLTVGSLVGQGESPQYHYRGWLKIAGDFDDEDVQLGAYYFDVTPSNFAFGGSPPYDQACTFQVAPVGAYGRCGFGGDYINGAYQPSFA